MSRKTTCIAHYTTIEALLSILKGDKDTPNHLCFWASRYSDLNDPTEFQFTHDLLKAQGADYQMIFPYTVSFCKTVDSPIMWRLYKAQVSLVFKRDIVKTTCDRKKYYLHDCQYIKEPSTLEIDKALRKIKIYSQDLAQEKQHQIKAAFIKHAEFSPEDECRLMIYNNPKSEDPDKDFFFRIKDEKLVSFKKVFLVKDALEKIIFYGDDNKQSKQQIENINNLLGQYNISADVERTHCIITK